MSCIIINIDKSAIVVVVIIINIYDGLKRNTHILASNPQELTLSTHASYNLRQIRTTAQFSQGTFLSLHKMHVNQ